MFDEILVADPGLQEETTSEAILVAHPELRRPAASEIIVAGADLQNAWDQYVNRHPDFTHCHRWLWKNVIENAFGHSTRYLVAREAGRI